MNNEEMQYLRELLYSDDENNLIKEIRSISNPLFLHIISANYNYNNGLNVPKAILDNKHCDFGTGLLLFYRVDGYRLLESKNVSDSPLIEWKEFLSNLYNRILDKRFSSQDISFTPPLTKVQIFKINKGNPSIPDIFISKSAGTNVGSVKSFV